MLATNDIVPESRSYINYRMFLFVLFCGVVLAVICSIIFSLIGFSLTTLIFIMVIATVIFGFEYIRLKTSLSKERYTLGNSLFLSHGGGLFTDYENELSIKNITQVKLVLPFLEYMLFKTGHVCIESAGASSTEIKLRSVANPEAIYDHVLERMKQNGFKLTRSHLVNTAKPHSLAVFFDAFQTAFGILFVAGYILLGIVAESKVNLIEFAQKYRSFLVPLGLLILIVFVAYIVLYYCDLLKRVYSVYDDAFEYREGFLNKAWSVIPIENISDSSVSQGLASRMFGLYDIKLSCQGASQEILFKNIVDGDKLSKMVDELIDKFKSSAKLSQEHTLAENNLSDKIEKSQTKTELEYDREFTYTFKLSVKKIWKEIFCFLPIYIIAFPLLIGKAIYACMLNSMHTFRIKKDSVEHNFKFISRHTREFAFDKITAIIFKESLIDKWCTSASLMFWSIGSGDNFIIPGVEMTDAIRNGLLAKKGIRQQDELYRLESDITLSSFFKANVLGCLLLAIVFFGCIYWLSVMPPIGQIIAAGIFIVSIAVSAYIFVYYKHMSLTFYEDYIIFKKGVLLKHTFYILYDDIKDIETIKYFLSTKGSICFNVAGEIIVKTNNGQIRKNCAFTISHVDKINVLDEIIDLIFHKRPKLKDINSLVANPRDTGEESILKSKPSKANSMFAAIVTLIPINAIVFFSTMLAFNDLLMTVSMGLIVLDILVVWIVFLNLDSVKYCMQSYRVAKRSGIFYKRQKSVIYDKIDFINNKQGLLNKIFSNGNISINTIGSSNVELELMNIKNYKQFYDLLKQKYSS